MNFTPYPDQRQGDAAQNKHVTPREWAHKLHFRPHVARALLIGRRPWHVAGRPVVIERGRR